MNEIQFAQLQTWFSNYCQGFHTDVAEDQRNYDLKELHTRHVAANMDALLSGEGLSEQWLYPARAVALLHDVGRFRQYREYRTFKDSTSVNHGALGARVIKEAGILSFLPPAEQQLILQTVRLHNVYALPANLSPNARTLLTLIRDADKLDIWRIFVEYFQQPETERASAAGLGFPDLPACTPAVVATLCRREMVSLSTLNTLNDFKLLQLSWVFDLNRPTSFSLVCERGFIPALAATLPESPEVRSAVDVVLTYCTEKHNQRLNAN